MNRVERGVRLKGEEFYNQFREELGQVWGDFQEYRQKPKEVATRKKLGTFLKSGLDSYGYTEEEIPKMVEAYEIFCFGLELAKRESRWLGDAYLIDRVGLDFDGDFLTGVDSGWDGRKRWITLDVNPLNLIRTISRSWYNAGVLYRNLAIEGQNFSKYFDDRAVVDLMIMSVDEHAHYLAYSLHSQKKIDGFGTDHEILNTLSDQLNEEDREGEGRVISHSDEFERRGMTWKSAVVRRNFPALSYFFDQHLEEIREYRRELRLEEW